MSESVYEIGVRRLNDVIKQIQFPKDRTIFIEGLKNFGDTLHSSVVVRHFRKLHPNHAIIWGISEKYYKQFKEAANAMGVVVFNLPHEATPEIRQNWKKEFAKLGLFKSIFPLCGVSGWDVGSNIVDAVMHNAGIKKLSVPKRPYFPHSGEDYAWHDRFSKKHDLKGGKYVVLEYNSYTLSKPPHEVTWNIDQYNELVKHLKCPVVFTGAASDPKLDHGIDARGCSWLQAKVMIERAGCLIGCGSGLSVLACAEGLSTYIIEINIGEPLTTKNIYGMPSISVKTEDPAKIAVAVNKYISGLNR